MASPAQILANQANAQSSTGPTTAQGKAASSQNATKHGLSSPFVVLRHEDQDQFNQVVEGLRDEHQPANPHQAFLVDQLAISEWQLARAQRLQTMAFEHLAGATAGSSDPDARIIDEMFKTNPNAIATLDRLAARAERSYHKAYKELRIAKQIQTEARIVGMLDSGTIERVINAPMPNHPAYRSQYGNPPPKSAVQNEPNPPANPAKKPSLRSTYPENLALCL